MDTSVLLLNNTYEPLGIVGLQRTVRLVFARQGRDRGGSWPRDALGGRYRPRGDRVRPAVDRALYYVAHRRKTVALTKKNILLRDKYRCQYCGVRGGSVMTVDHVVPKSRGGPSSWTNLVACCAPCNGRIMWNKRSGEGGEPPA